MIPHNQGALNWLLLTLNNNNKSYKKIEIFILVALSRDIEVFCDSKQYFFLIRFVVLVYTDGFNLSDNLPGNPRPYVNQMRNVTNFAQGLEVNNSDSLDFQYVTFQRQILLDNKKKHLLTLYHLFHFIQLSSFTLLEFGEKLFLTQVSIYLLGRYCNEILYYRQIQPIIPTIKGSIKYIIYD